MNGGSVSLSLISHTNAGKTTLARTLLGRDVGEVRDAPNVTQEATAYPMIATPDGDALILWDTPGFGDSARLGRRLAQQGNPIGWFLSQVWDRYSDRAFWLTQKAVANVREQADVVLYLVNASEEPGDAGYLAPELAVLEWIGKPVMVLLNQTGRPRPHEEEAADEQRWRVALGARPIVHAVVSLDAFARCWVQEITLLRSVADAMPAVKRESYARLVDAWQSRRFEQFDEAMSVLASQISRAACDSETLPVAGLKGVMRELGSAMGIGEDPAPRDKAHAADALAKRLDADIRAGTDRLIAIHGLEGHASGEVLARVASNVTVDAPLNEGKAAMMGGVVSGALTGLAADLASGGMTFGAGMLAGAVLGAVGGAGIARGMNLARGKAGATLRWDDAFLTGLVASALLRYLTVAHYGRGRGEWVESECPPFWTALITGVVEARRNPLERIWKQRETACDTAALERALAIELGEAARTALAALYPDRPGTPAPRQGFAAGNPA